MMHCKLAVAGEYTGSARAQPHQSLQQLSGGVSEPQDIGAMRLFLFDCTDGSSSSSKIMLRLRRSVSAFAPDISLGLVTIYCRPLPPHIPAPPIDVEKASRVAACMPHTNRLAFVFSTFSFRFGPYFHSCSKRQCRHLLLPSLCIPRLSSFCSICKSATLPSPDVLVPSLPLSSLSSGCYAISNRQSLCLCGPGRPFGIIISIISIVIIFFIFVVIVIISCNRCSNSAVPVDISHSVWSFFCTPLPSITAATDAFS